MEVKINREIKDYTENMFFGLSIRQCFCSALAILCAVGLYILCCKHFSVEITSWFCIFGAIPFALFGFVKYQGMPAEKFLWIWLRSQIIEPKEFPFETKNLFHIAIKQKGGKLESFAKSISPRQ